MTTNEEHARAFLQCHETFDGWQESWKGVPLAFRVGLTSEIPQRDVIASVRAIVLRGDRVLLVHAEVPLLTVGGRPEPGETLAEALEREFAEETGWRVVPIGVIRFVHALHLDEQRPAWGRPAPHFLDVVFAVEAVSFEESRQGADEWKCDFVPIASLEEHAIHSIDATMLEAALSLRHSAVQ
jgi:ADP-ribose pyrophosphatase YjhB (NUDIX family)